MTSLQQAREAAASHYPDHLIDTKGRKHPCIPRKAIEAGLWDSGRLVQEALAALK